jgi:hypothetical protein
MRPSGPQSRKKTSITDTGAVPPGSRTGPRRFQEVDERDSCVFRICSGSVVASSRSRRVRRSRVTVSIDDSFEGVRTVRERSHRPNRTAFGWRLMPHLMLFFPDRMVPTRPTPAAAIYRLQCTLPDWARGDRSRNGGTNCSAAASR